MRHGEAAELVSPERPQRPAVGAGELVADHDRQVERLRDRLDPADQIDRRPDHGEIETVGSADIAVYDRAGMQRDDDVQRRFARHGGILAEPVHRRERLQGCIERVARGLGGGARRFDREDGQQAVADEFQDLAAVVVNGLGLRVEQRVEQVENCPPQIGMLARARSSALRNRNYTDYREL
jgi:hypothetical protein